MSYKFQYGNNVQKNIENPLRIFKAMQRRLFKNKPDYSKKIQTAAYTIITFCN
ncbi:hypothetical protein HMPREF9554_01333 [Treponema phagedenis F0421]|nr:hypothetical protein HMPREF9554_01333 [Treponema phagedenis F0421]